MGTTADMVEISKHISDEESKKLGSLIMASVSQNVMNKTWMQGPANLVEAISDPQRYGDRYIRQLAGTVVPNVFAQYANTQDPYMREARSVLDAVKNRIPGQKETLFVKRDIFGEPIKRENELGLANIANPVRISSEKNDPAVTALLDAKYYPSKPQRKIMNVELTDYEYDRYSTLSGKFFKSNLDSMITTPGWQKFSPEMRKLILGKLHTETSNLGRASLLAESPALQAILGKQKLDELNKLINVQ